MKRLHLMKNKTILDVCKRFSAGDAIKAKDIKVTGKYPVFGANGIRGYTDTFNFDGQCAVIGRQGAESGNVHYYEGKAYMTEHAIVAEANEENCSGYLAYKLMQMNLARYQGQSAQPGISAKTISELPIDIPDLEYQKLVFGALNNLEKKITNNEAIAHQLEAMAKIIYDYWFLQFEFPNEKGKPYKSSGGKMVWNEELQQEIPVGWTSAKLKDIIIENPKSKIKVSDVKNDGEIPFFTSGTDILSTSESIVSGLNCYLNTGGNADVKYYYGEASYSTDTWCITAENETKYILPFVLNKIKPSMDKVFFQGTGLRHLQKNLLREYQFCLPDSNVVKEFSKLASDIFKKQHYLLKENKKLESLKQFLLPLLMNGQVTINEK